MFRDADKIIVAIALFCYIAATSLASVHASPLMTTQGSAPDVQIMSLDDQDMNENCHSPSSPPCEQSKSGVCKIFCAAMAQAITFSHEAALITLRPTTFVTDFRSLATSRLPSVEPHPPKYNPNN